MYKAPEGEQKRWVKSKKPSPIDEINKILKEKPELIEQVEKLLKISQSNEQDPRDVNDVEQELIEALRVLGQTSMKSWAQEVGEHCKQEVRRSPEKYRYGKKKSCDG